ncbi:HAMP domain-containing sensor histidine kinase [Paenibacillus polymyxa]|uniref:HAMP domain-containing sensor histidine kinase n=1 Tax=Paenibacillus polymyxa TaxID=1406 RepID=UPI0025B6ED71|nr:HAMP domain-containing sensor histidine kinase [Paenibacillus polymyxa]MDN4082903.1 HAMP domain-containing sensor histidine kinase [Paenibacillus polymyxa]MDN4107041.1 HAMP domain-containing sensor histidine kinase [Paenibacillus polymyxa]
MKLKIKLPLLFLLMFIIFMFSIGMYLKLVFAVYSPIRSSLLDSRYIALLLPIFAIACIIFIILIIYIHFCIEKPIQLLNTRLEEVNIVHPLPPLALRSNDEIGELYKHFNKMEHRLQLAHKEQTDMIAAIAHDLKTPLTSINGFTELLAMHKDLPETEKQEYYDLIQKKSGYMVELINDFSSFTKEKLELESMVAKPVKASKLFENIALEYEYELAGLDNELTCRHSFTENIWLMINEPMIRRVFGNLFSNAVRYGGKNKLKVYMTGYPLGQYAFFQIEDNGIGVPDKDISSLFLKFFTVNKSRQIQKGGLGLGLASCKSIIEHHRGEIDAYPSEYGGLGIRFSLPLAAQH